MRCVTVESLTPDWIREKLDCINRRAWDHAGEIKELIGRKLGQRSYLTPEEFSRILVFKGLAKSKDAFLKEYQPLNAIQERTTELLASGLESYRFEDTADDGKRRDILEIAQKMMRLLVGIKYVGVPVSCAALRLTYPHLFGTVDYIVPGLLHCQKDDMGTENPLWAGFENGLALRECMRLPDGSGMSPNEARDLAQKNYRGYTEELWDIKWKLGLSEFEVSEIETAIWSYGICHIKRQKDSRSQSLPFRFQVKPNSPRGGLFAKNCPNEINRAGFQANSRLPRAVLFLGKHSKETNRPTRLTASLT